MKKHLWFTISLIALALLLAACTAEPSPGVTPVSSDAETTTAAITVNDTETTRPTETTAETTIPETEEPEETEELVTTEKPTLESFMLEQMRLAGCTDDEMVTLFSSLNGYDHADLTAWLNEEEATWFLAYAGDDGTFIRPEDMQLSTVLYASRTDPNFVRPQEELEALEKVHPYGEEVSHYGYRRLTGEQLEELVQKYLGISLTQEMIDRMLASEDTVCYLPAFDVYYLIASDSNIYGSPCILRGYETDDGRFLLLLHSYPAEEFRIVLCSRTETGFQYDMIIHVDSLF